MERGVTYTNPKPDPERPNTRSSSQNELSSSTQTKHNSLDPYTPPPTPHPTHPPRPSVHPPPPEPNYSQTAFADFFFVDFLKMYFLNMLSLLSVLSQNENVPAVPRRQWASTKYGADFTFRASPAQQWGLKERERE